MYWMIWFHWLSSFNLFNSFYHIEFFIDISPLEHSCIWMTLSGMLPYTIPIKKWRDWNRWKLVFLRRFFNVQNSRRNACGWNYRRKLVNRISKLCIVFACTGVLYVCCQYEERAKLRLPCLRSEIEYVGKHENFVHKKCCKHMVSVWFQAIYFDIPSNAKVLNIK